MSVMLCHNLCDASLPLVQHYENEEFEHLPEYFAILLVRHVRYHIGELQMQRMLVYTREVSTSTRYCHWSQWGVCVSSPCARLDACMLVQDFFHAPAFQQYLAVHLPQVLVLREQ
jgi:hypothetical protein